MFNNSSPCPSCFRPQTPATEDDRYHQRPNPQPLSPATNSSNPKITTTCHYQTEFGLFTLTWSRSFLGHSLLLHLHHRNPIDHINSSPISLSKTLSSLSTISFHLRIKPFMFWNKQGFKKLHATTTNQHNINIHVAWDLSRAKFGSRPDPETRFFIAVVIDREMALLVGDLTKEAYKRTKAIERLITSQALVMRRERMVFSKRSLYTTKARFGGKIREISIDCDLNNDERLCFGVDNKRVLIIKRLKWKFRGNEKIEVDGVVIQVSWDLFNWLFDHDNKCGHAVFMFRFETQDRGIKQDVDQEDCFSREEEYNEKEWRKVRKSSSLSSISMSSASSSGRCSSVMEWTSMEETKLSGSQHEFCLLVYAWKK